VRRIGFCIFAMMLCSWRAAPQSGRLIAVIGDLHLGPARNDFRWGDDLAAFLKAVNQAGNGSTDLVLNGDTFDLTGCRHTDPRLGCTEAEALALLDKTLTAHSAEISQLSAFAHTGMNRITIVPGDQDAALLYAAVSKRAGQAVGGDIASRGSWVSPDGAVYVEHGHQLASDPFRFTHWPQPFIKDSGTDYVERTWGEQLVTDLYNQNKARFPILDSIAEDGAGLKYGIAADPKIAERPGIGPLLKFFLTRMTWQQFRQDLDGGAIEAPAWDLAAIRKLGPAFFAASLLPDDRFHALADKAAASGNLKLDPADFPDAELTAICDYRGALRRARRRNERSMTQVPFTGPSLQECPRLESTRGPEFGYFWRSRNIRFTAEIENKPIKLFVYGHTHLPNRGFVPDRQGQAPQVMSPGAWRRTITPNQLDEMMKDRGWSEADALSKLAPEELPACYGVIWIAPYAGTPAPALRFWRHDGKWGTLTRDAVSAANACSASPVGAP
jgi:hypothetical protein